MVLGGLFGVSVPIVVIAPLFGLPAFVAIVLGPLITLIAGVAKYARIVTHISVVENGRGRGVLLGCQVTTLALMALSVWGVYITVPSPMPAEPIMATQYAFIAALVVIGYGIILLRRIRNESRR